MKFPVDLLADVGQAELERLAHDYMNDLLYSDPDRPDHLGLSNSTQVTIDISSVGFVPLYGSGDKQKVLALFAPSDPFTAVALYLLDRWWAVDDILKTADPTRGGAVEVETLGERIVLYILNRVVYRAKEMRPEDLPFLLHGEKDNAKILWNDGEAVGFYSVKPSGSFCSSFSTRSYQLPVMDSIFVRKSQRGKGFGLQMLEDFVLSFKEDCLGLRYPVTKFMYKVCEQYLCQYPGDTHLLWEVESSGGPKQRTSIARKIQAMHQSAAPRSLTFTEESLVITERTEQDVMATQIKEAGSMERTVEIVEEVTVLGVTKEAEVPLTARGRSSGSKRRRMGGKTGEDKAEKVIRIEDIEAESRSKDQVSAQQKTELHVSESGMSSVAPEEQEEDMVDDAAKMLDQPDTILAQQDLEEADVTSPLTEEPQVEDDAHQNLNSQITVENVASEVEEEFQEEDSAVSEGASEEAETLDEVGEGTHVGVTDEKSEETGRANAEAVTTVQSMTPGLRCTPHSAVTVTVTMEEEQCAVSEMCADTPGGDDAEGNLPLALVDESMSYEEEEEEAPVVETRALRRKTSAATPRRTSTRGRKQVDEREAENSEEEPAVTTRTLRRGRMSTTDTPKGKSRRSRKQIQEETQKGGEESEGVEETGVVEEDAAKEAAVEKTDEEMVDTGKESASEEEEGLELKMDDAEEEVAEQKQDAEEEEVAEQTQDAEEEEVAEQKQGAEEEEVAEQKQGAEEEEVAEQTQAAEEVITGLGSDPPTEVDERKAPKEDEIEAEDEDLVTAELESEEGTTRMTVEEEDTAGVMAAADDLAQKETYAPSPSPPTDSAVEEEATASAEEQQSEDTATQLSDLRRVTVVLVDLQKPHHDVQEEAAAAEEGLPVRKTAAEAEVEATKIQDPEEGRDEETAEEEKAESVNVEEQKPPVTETRTPRSGTQAVEATPRTRGRPRKGQERKEAAPAIRTEEPAAQVRVLRTGRTSLPVAQRSAIKRTRKQLQEEEEEEGGEESTAAEAMDQEKEETLEERDATEQVENIEAEMALEKEDTEDAVNQHDAQEEGRVETVADEDGEASVEHDHEEKTFVVAEEAVAKRDTAEGEPSTSASEVAESVPETAKDEQANDASEEEAPVVERVLRSGEKTARRSETTKKPGDEQEEEAPAEKSTGEDEPAVEIRVLRKGRKPAEDAPRRKSKRARTQCQTEEEGDEEEEEEEEEATPTEEIEGEEEEEAGRESPEEKGIAVEEMEEEEEEEEATVEAVDGTRTDAVLPSSVEVEESDSDAEDETSVAEVGSDAAIAEEEAPVEEASAAEEEEEDAPAADDSPRRSVRKRPKVDYRENNEGNADEEKEVPGASGEDQGNQRSERSSNADEVGEAAGSSQEHEEDEQNTSEEEEEPIVIGKRVLRGRSVPSVIMTPQSTSRRRGAKTAIEEKIHRSARKRKSTEVTRKSQRLSRV